MRALLIVNPRATSTTTLRRDVIVGALASDLDLVIAHTRYRGHAATLARSAAAEGHAVILTLGGDGTVNEVVNGLLTGGTGRQRPGGIVDDSAAAPDESVGTARELPAIAPIPGGSANVFARALGLPVDPVDATGTILGALRAGRERHVGLGLAGGRYFTFSAGLGLDAEVVRAVEGFRASGRRASPALYVWTALRQFYAVTDRRRPALTVVRDGQAPVGHLFLGIISNASPWTYLGARPVNPSPMASFDTGLDVFALRRLRTLPTLRAVRHMLGEPDHPPHGRHVTTLHDQAEFTLRSCRPIAFQVDGEYVGERECVTFRSVPNAVRVII